MPNAEIEPLASEQAAEMYFLRRRQTVREQVREFHKAMGVPTPRSPTVPSEDRIKLRLALIAEEFAELCEALGWPIVFEMSRRGHFDMVEAADALADLDYVIEGTRLELGIDGEPIAAEVHCSNMSKLGEDGKVTKGPNYSPPDIAACLRAQGWDGK